MKSRPSRVLEWSLTMFAVAASAAGCGTEGDSPIEVASEALTGDCEYVAGRGDGDGDGIDDAKEDCVLAQNAPIMHISTKESRQPANVDWFLARSRLRFHHNNCGDCPVVDRPVAQHHLASGGHNKKKGLFSGCGHQNSPVWITDGNIDQNHHYFLELMEGGARDGSSNPADWVVYGHVYPNRIGGVNAQYWFFYPYSDAFTTDNHEGDWESMVVQRNSIGGIDSVWYWAHGTGQYAHWNEVRWSGRHPHGWVADGTHASYVNESRCDSEERHWYGDFIDSCDTINGYEWYTWAGGKGSNPGRQGAGIINLGEKDRPLNGQVFILGRNVGWGEKGSFHSGPTGPTTNEATWNFNRR